MRREPSCCKATAYDKGQVVGEENVHYLPSPGRNPFVLGIVAAVSGNYLNNPYPQGILMPTANTGGLAMFLGQSISFTDSNRVIPRVH